VDECCCSQTKKNISKKRKEEKTVLNYFKNRCILESIVSVCVCGCLCVQVDTAGEVSLSGNQIETRVPQAQNLDKFENGQVSAASASNGKGVAACVFI
jgi:hypothetical protein